MNRRKKKNISQVTSIDTKIPPGLFSTSVGVKSELSLTTSIRKTDKNTNIIRTGKVEIVCVKRGRQEGMAVDEYEPAPSYNSSLRSKSAE